MNDLNIIFMSLVGNRIIILVLVLTRYKHAVASCVEFGKFDVFFLTGNREIELSNIQHIYRTIQECNFIWS